MSVLRLSEKIHCLNYRLIFYMHNGVINRADSPAMEVKDEASGSLGCSCQPCRDGGARSGRDHLTVCKKNTRETLSRGMNGSPKLFVGKFQGGNQNEDNKNRRDTGAPYSRPLPHSSRVFQSRLNRTRTVWNQRSTRSFARLSGGDFFLHNAAPLCYIGQLAIIRRTKEKTVNWKARKRRVSRISDYPAKC